MDDDSDHVKQKSRAELLRQANDIMKSFLLGGLKVQEGDSCDLLLAVRQIIASTADIRRSAVKEFLSTGDMDSFLLSLIPVHDCIFYDAYAPYWLRHCKPVTDSDDEVEFTFYNDLIDMYWAAKWQEWKKKGEWCVTIMLPPTKGLIALQRNS